MYFAYYFAFIFGFHAVASAYDCSNGESYWCSDIKIAAQCGAIQHCIQTVWRNQLDYKEDSSDVCQFCEQIIGDVRSCLLQNQSWNQVSQYMHAACQLLPDKNLQQQCDDMVNMYIKELRQLIQSDLDPKAVCAAVRLCSGFENNRIAHSNPVMKSTPYLAIDPVPVAIDTVQKDPQKFVLPTPFQQLKSYSNNEICSECEGYISDIRLIISDKTNQKDIENLFDQYVCSKLGSFSSACNAYVAEYAPQLFELLENELNGKSICTAIGLCSAKNVDPLILIKKKLSSFPVFKMIKKIDGAEECSLCKDVMTELQNLDRDPNVQKTVEEFIENNICSRLGSFKPGCDSYVNEYAPIVFELLVNELDPTTRCTSFGFCSSINSLTRTHMIKKKVSPSVKSTKLGSIDCDVCKVVVGQVEKHIEQNKTEAQIIEDVEKICSFLPDTIKLQCKDFLNVYGHTIIQLLISKVSPSLICSEIGYCSKDASLKQSVSDSVKSSIGCGVCQTVIQYIDDILVENATVSDIEKALDKVCSVIPSSYKSECQQLVNQYAPMLISLLAQDVNPLAVCQDINLCASKSKMNRIIPKKVKMLGMEKCTYGPAYWCASKENAKRCKAVEHCVAHVWKN